jgi:signal transduction histidine kinase
VADPMEAGVIGRPWQWLGIGACVAVAIGVALALVPLGYPLDGAGVQLGVYCSGYLIAGSIAWLRRPANPVGPVMLATAVAICLSFLLLHPEPFVRRLAGLSGSIANVLVVWIMLAAPAGRLAPGPGRWVLAAFTVVVVLGAFVDDLTVRRVIWAAGVAVSLTLAAVVIKRWVDASGPARRSLAPIVVAGVTAALVHALDFAAGVLLIQVTPGTPLYAADVVSRTLVPYGFLIGLLRLRIARGAVADLVVELGDTPPPDRLADALSSALGDPDLEVLYWSPSIGRYSDRHGKPVDLDQLTPGRAVTHLERDGRPLAVLVLDPALAEDPGLVPAVAAAVRLAVDNERLAAEVRSQLDEVRASRTRIVEASDAERRRVERNLHDGAQQRLVALSLALRRAQTQLPADAGPELADTLAVASVQLRDALAELRELARGIHPAILTEAGLAAALRSLVRDSPVPGTARIDLPDGIAESVAAAAYFVAAEAIANVAKYADATKLEVEADIEDDELRVAITDDGRGGADPTRGSGLQELHDRVAALDGRIEIRSPAGQGTSIVARLPLQA